MVASVVTDVAAERSWVLLAYGQRLIGVALERRLVETPASRSNARRSERSFRSESSIKSSIPTHTGASASSFNRKSGGLRGFCRALWRTRTADPLLTMDGVVPAGAPHPERSGKSWAKPPGRC